MSVSYDKYYQTERLFGNPYPELIDFFGGRERKGKLLDLGCGQGRDAIAIARLGYEVLGIDNSKVGIGQMNQISKSEDLSLTGLVQDIYRFDDFEDFDYVLLDSMFHFTKKDIAKETAFIKRILSSIKIGCMIVFCIQDTGQKVEILEQILGEEKQIDRLTEKHFEYIFEDKETGHKSITTYRMIVVERI